MSLLTTGTKLIISSGWKDHMDLIVQASTADYRLTEGLCGSFDGNKENDFVHKGTQYMSCPNSHGDDARTDEAIEFGKSWRYTLCSKILYQHNDLSNKMIAVTTFIKCICILINFSLFRIKEMGLPSLLNPVVLNISGDHLCQCNCDLRENKDNCGREDVAVCKPEAFTTRCEQSRFKPHLQQMCESSRKRRSVEGHKDDYSNLERQPSEDLPDLGSYV